MQTNSLQQNIQRAFSVVDAKAGSTALEAACRQLFLKSDLYRHGAYSPAEIDIIARAIVRYILEPETAWHRLELLEDHAIVGRGMDMDEFAKLFAFDMLCEASSPDIAKSGGDVAVMEVSAFLAGIFFHYKFCLATGSETLLAVFIRRFALVTRDLMQRSGDARSAADTGWIVLNALCAFDNAQGFR